jgi:hypothetical protein
MNVRNTIPVCLAATAGFLLGAMFTRQTPVRAQSGTSVYTVSDSMPGMGSTSIPSGQVVGFSCVEEHIANVESPRCYIAYIK